MKSIFLKGMIILAVWVILSTQAIFAAETPIGLLQSLANQMIESLKANKATLKTHPSLVYSLAYKIVVPHADLVEMSKRVLPPQTWSSATPGQRAQFQKEFTKLLVRTYASALADYSDETVQFYPVRGGFAGKENVQVNSKIIRSEGPPINVSYRLTMSGGQWKLYDMSVEGVSMLESFRSQFSDALSRGEMTTLIEELRAHNSRD